MLPSFVLAAVVLTSPADTLDGRVTIRRDEFGVPHIFAATVPDGFFGLAYAQSEDLLESLLTLIVRARGELASARGTDALASDIEQRKWQHVEAARAGFGRLSPMLQDAYRAYIEGIQAYIREHPGRAPAWTPRLEPTDAMVLTRSVLWTAYQAGIGLRDCQRAGIRLAAASTESPDGISVASNEWVLAPWRTAD